MPRLAENPIRTQCGHCRRISKDASKAAAHVAVHRPIRLKDDILSVEKPQNRGQIGMEGLGHIWRGCVLPCLCDCHFPAKEAGGRLVPRPCNDRTCKELLADG